MLEFKLLALLLIANGAPVIAWDLFRERYAWPVDFGILLPDRRPLFGPAKTWRGLMASLTATPGLAPILGLPVEAGLAVAAAAMAGDLLSSFVKRRLHIEPSDRARGLDQIPESLLPLVTVKGRFGLDWGTITLLVAVFFVLEVSLSPVLYRLGLRRRPY